MPRTWRRLHSPDQTQPAKDSRPPDGLRVGAKQSRRCRFGCRLTPTFSGIAKGEQRQITLSVNDLQISCRTSYSARSPDKREVGSSTLPRPIKLSRGERCANTATTSRETKPPSFWWRL